VGLPPTDGFLFAIGVSVALVPEGLLPTVTLSLSVGARRMARHGALVRRLDAVETLGSTTFICTDKTGTLTENRMSAVCVWTPHGSAQLQGQGYEPTAEITGDLARETLARVALAAVRCSLGRAQLRDGSWQASGDPMEAALHALALRAGVDVAEDERARPSLARNPFDATRRRMSVLVPGELLVKGAPDALLPLTAARPEAREALQRLAARGLRVLGIARRAFAAASCDESAERELELLALVGFEDPPRAGAKSAIAACRGAGMRVAMITGDHPGTARAIAREVGLGGEHVYEGAGLPEDDAQLGALLDRDGVVVCRVTPEQKLRILIALQARGHVVAMTGDGVNDGPALQQADIGIAMGRSGTDVAREAADLVLLDDDFSTIVEAVRQGRATFSNIRRFLTYHLTDNVAELAPFLLWALTAGRVPLALSVLQILCLDLVTDQLPALALGAELPSARVLSMPPHRRHLVDRRLLVRALLVLGPVEALVSLGAFGAAWLTAGSALSASGAAFSAVVLGQVVNALACRSETHAAWAVGRQASSLLWTALGLELTLLLGSLYFAPAARLLAQAPPSLAGWAIAALALVLVPLADASFKRLSRA
jgi:calcium-translocating P-type ATPase